MRIAIIGLGIVATSDALALARTHEVVMTGPVPDRVDAINVGAYPLTDPSVSTYIASHSLNLRATLNTAEALEGAGMVMISLPVSLDLETNGYCTAELESRIEFAHRNCPGVPIVIRAAVPIGFTNRMRAELNARSILVAPEFMRTHHSLQDALDPGFQIVGDRGPLGTKAGAVLLSAALRPGVQIRLVGASEAEAIKHFSQAYLASRIAYFNELDSYALAKGLNSRQVIDGVCLDPRIGTYANNPCFGVGGQRVPRSIQHLSELVGSVPAHILPSVANASGARIALLAAKVMECAPRTVGVYNPGGAFDAPDPLSALRERLLAEGAIVRTYTGILSADGNDLAGFKAACDVVVAQRITPELMDIRAKVFSRDLYALSDSTPRSLKGNSLEVSSAAVLCPNPAQ